MFSIVYLSNKSWAILPVLSANAPCLPLSTGSHILKLRDDSGVLTDFSHPTAFTKKILSHKSCILKRWWVKQYLLWNTEHYLPTAFVEGILKQNNWIKKYHGIVVSQYFASIIKMHALCFKNVMCRETHTYFTGSLTLIFLKFLLIELILTLTRFWKKNSEEVILDLTHDWQVMQREKFAGSEVFRQTFLCWTGWLWTFILPASHPMSSGITGLHHNA